MAPSIAKPNQVQHISIPKCEIPGSFLDFEFNLLETDAKPDEEEKKADPKMEEKLKNSEEQLMKLKLEIEDMKKHQ